MKRITALLLLTVTACASTKKYDRLMEGWKGQPVARFFSIWGPPEGIVNLPDGGKAMAWTWNGSDFLDAVYSSKPGPTGRLCRTEMTVDSSGIITAVHRSGETCWAK